MGGFCARGIIARLLLHGIFWSAAVSGISILHTVRKKENGLKLKTA